MNRMHHILYHTDFWSAWALKVGTWLFLGWALMVLDGRDTPSNFAQALTAAAVVQLAYIGLRRLT